MSDSDYLLDDDGPEWTVADTARQLALDLQEVEAERDRLQAAVDELTETGTRDLHVLHRISTAVGARENLPDAVLAALNERDRLRAVVDAVRHEVDRFANLLGLSGPEVPFEFRQWIHWRDAIDERLADLEGRVADHSTDDTLLIIVAESVARFSGDAATGLRSQLDGTGNMGGQDSTGDKGPPVPATPPSTATDVPDLEASAARGAGAPNTGAPTSWSEFAATIVRCGHCAGFGCDECGGTGEAAAYGRDEFSAGGAVDG